MVKEGYCQCGCGNKTSLIRVNNKTEGYVKGTYRKFITHHNLIGKRENSMSWKGGYALHNNGYPMTWKKGHPRAGKNNYVLTHILIAEKVLGKSIPVRISIHHHPKLQDYETIVICENNSYHQLLHQRMKALKNCGHATWKWCWICKKWDDPKNMVFRKGNVPRHLTCECKYRRESRRRKKEFISQKTF